MENKINKLCEICGHKAKSLNFGVICCEPCKSFFRRNLHKPKPFICVFNDNCIISADTRNDCKKCRLNKCLSLGMKCNFQSNENEIQIIECKITERQSNSGEKSDGESEESYNEYTDYDSIVQQIDTIIVNANKEGYNSALIPISKPLTDYNGLRQLEFRRISEAIGASKAFIEPMAKNIYKVRDKIEFLAIKSQMNDKLAKNTIKYTKGLKGFADLRPEDQYSLFKYGCIQIIYIRQLTHYNQNTRYFIMNMLTAIILFDPNRPNLIHRDIIRLEQQLYIYLLQRYLLLKCGSESESQTKLQTFMTSLKDLEAIHDIQRWELTKDWEYPNPTLITPKSVKFAEIRLIVSRNYGAISCASCKAFFRRNSFKHKKFVCILNDDCLLSIETRNNCKKCRIDKCFQIGMKKEIIRQKENNEIIENQFSNQKHISQMNSSLTSLSDESQDDLWELIDDIIDCNTDSSDDVFALQVMDINTTDTALLPISKPLTDYNGLKQLELSRISEVITASTVFMSSLPKNNNDTTLVANYETYTKICKDDWFLLEQQ
ncbi:unnamed protein product, partial [Medioppia subpectinata]